jgi:hypothetical protein
MDHALMQVLNLIRSRRLQLSRGKPQPVVVETHDTVDRRVGDIDIMVVDSYVKLRASEYRSAERRAYERATVHQHAVEIAAVKVCSGQILSHEFAASKVPTGGVHSGADNQILHCRPQHDAR